MNVKILLFAEARDILEADWLDLEVEINTNKAQILAKIGEKFQALHTILDVCNLAHNHVRIRLGASDLNQSALSI